MFFCRFATLALGFVFVLGCPPLDFENSVKTLKDGDYDKYRLPNHVVPTKYDLKLKPDLEKATFTGSLTLNFDVTESSSNITLHAKQLKLDKANVEVLSVDEENNKPIEVVDIELSTDDTNFFIVYLKDPLEKNKKYVLNVKSYSGILHDDNGGFYLAKYKDEDGTEKRLATTQFESTNARRAFPCLDEPAIKAEFDVTLVRKNHQSSISNEKLLETNKIDEEYSEDKFKVTKKMSTYLAAFVVSEFGHVKEGSHRVYARPEAIKEKKADYALKSGIAILKLLADYLKHQYEFSKMDQIGIPDKYFAAGAMENWGLVTYRENSLLYDPATSTSIEKQRVTTIIAHEFAHQWFGNLVTCNWWKYIWLNEGFATYFENYAASLYQQDWRLMDQYVLTNVQNAFIKDALETTEAMNHEGYPGSGPSTHVAYQKSGSVIRMFEHFLTHDVFRSGLQKYLEKKKYDSATPDDLYSALQEALDEQNKRPLLGGKTVKEILDTWTNLKGYPVVNVKLVDKKIEFSQSRYLTNKPSETSNDIWFVPINCVFGKKDETPDFSKTTADMFLTEQKKTVDISEGDIGKIEWIIVNKQQTGYYRVNYEEANWKKLISVLKSDQYEKIHVLNRAQLVDDAFNLARSGRLQYDIAFNLGNYLSRELDYIPLTAFLNNVEYLNNMLAKKGQYSSFKVYVRDILKTAYKNLTAEERPEVDKHVDKLNRANVLNWLCKLGHDECRKAALEKLNKWIASEKDIIKPDLQASMFCGAIAKGTQEKWNFLYKKYTELEKQPLLQARIIKALGCSENENIIKSYLNKILTDDAIEEHRTAALSSVITSGPVGLKLAFAFVEENYQALKDKKVDVKTVIPNIGKLLTTTEEVNRMKALKAKHTEEQSAFDDAIKNAEENVNWLKLYSDNITKWLSDNVKGAGAQVTVNITCLLVSIIIAFYASM